MLYFIAAAAALYVLGLIFYHNLIISAFLIPLALFYPKIKTREIIRKRKNELNLQFKDVLYSLSSSLTAGKSVELAFKEVLKDLSVLYPNPETYIIKEVEYVVRKIEMNETIESALEDLAKRSDIEDIQNFSDVFQTCKRTGGNLVEVVRNSSNIINDKIEIKEEINTLLASKKFEQKIMSVMPVLMILVLSLTSADYMEKIFTTNMGKAVMTVAIGLILAGYFIANKIMNIKV